jgi:hypothetical protein
VIATFAGHAEQGIAVMQKVSFRIFSVEAGELIQTGKTFSIRENFKQQAATGGSTEGSCSI